MLKIIRYSFAFVNAFPISLTRSQKNLIMNSHLAKFWWWHGHSEHRVR